jgi:hypothetical protein
MLSGLGPESGTAGEVERNGEREGAAEAVANRGHARAGEQVCGRKGKREQCGLDEGQISTAAPAIEIPKGPGDRREGWIVLRRRRNVEAGRTGPHRRCPEIRGPTGREPSLRTG